MKNVPQVNDKTIERLLENSASMYDIAADQRRKAVELARNNAFTIHRIAGHIGRSYTATRALTSSTSTPNDAN